jgi:hypothetical protein
MIHRAYKHLDSKLRVAELTLGQWAGVFFGAALGIGYAHFLHLLGGVLNTVTAVYIGGLPAAAALLSGFSEFDTWLLVRSAVRWRRMDGQHQPGPGLTTVGYRVEEAERDRSELDRLSTIDPSSLWSDHEY